MGYEVRITRKNNWWEEDGPEIPLAEWIAVVNADREMRMDGFAETRGAAGAVIRIKHEGLAVWTAYSRQNANGRMAWFDLRNGNVVVKTPDTEVLRKMWSLAEALSAKVQGDEGELYDASGRQLPIQRDRI